MANSCHQAKGHKPVLRCDFSAVSQVQNSHFGWAHVADSWPDLRLATKFVVARRHPGTGASSVRLHFTVLPFLSLSAKQATIEESPLALAIARERNFPTKRQFQARRQQ
jgi:hypothetical protein